MRILRVGASATPICGIRSYARRLDAALALHGAEVRACWWEREGTRDVAGAWPGFRRFTREATAEAAASHPDWILLHYSVFTWSSFGQPWLVPPLVRWLRSLRRPVVAVLHEYALPLRGAGLKAAAGGVAQRAVMPPLVAAADRCVVTQEERAAYLRTRRWLPTRPTAFLPVSSNVDPALDAARPPARTGPVVVGVFGFGLPTYRADLVVEAIRDLRSSGADVRLRMVGHPGPDSPAGRAWQAAAAGAGLDGAVEFTGVVDEPRLRRELAGVDIVASPDPGGPSSRRTTLAAPLALGLPVVALDGPETWPRMSAAGAVVTCPPSRAGLVAALRPLVDDPAARARQGDLGADFYHAEMSPEVVGGRLLELLGSGPAGRRRH